MHTRAPLYFLVQAVLIGAWWLGVLLSPHFRLWFFPASQDALAFVLPDVVVAMGGSVGTAILALRKRRNAGHAALYLGLITSGGMAYATLVCIAWAFLHGLWLGAVVMGVATVASFYFAFGMQLAR